MLDRIVLTAFNNATAKMISLYTLIISTYQVRASVSRYALFICAGARRGIAICVLVITVCVNEKILSYCRKLTCHSQATHRS